MKIGTNAIVGGLFAAAGASTLYVYYNSSMRERIFETTRKAFDSFRLCKETDRTLSPQRYLSDSDSESDGEETEELAKHQKIIYIILFKILDPSTAMSSL